MILTLVVAAAVTACVLVGRDAKILSKVTLEGNVIVDNRNVKSTSRLQRESESEKSLQEGKWLTSRPQWGIWKWKQVNIEKNKAGAEKSKELKLIFSASYLTFPLSCSVGSLPLMTVGELGANFVYLGKVFSGNLEIKFLKRQIGKLFWQLVSHSKL